MVFFWGGGLWEEEELCNLRSLKDTLESKIISASFFSFSFLLLMVKIYLTSKYSVK